VTGLPLLQVRSRRARDRSPFRASNIAIDLGGDQAAQVLREPRGGLQDMGEAILDRGGLRGSRMILSHSRL
jgi:hypothetical protein